MKDFDHRCEHQVGVKDRFIPSNLNNALCFYFSKLPLMANYCNKFTQDIYARGFGRPLFLIIEASSIVSLRHVDRGLPAGTANNNDCQSVIKLL
jgi:hypothetical protein